MTIGEGIGVVMFVLTAATAATALLVWLARLADAQARILDERFGRPKLAGIPEPPGYRGPCRCGQCRRGEGEPASDYSGE